MPSGRVHNLINIATYAALGAGAIWLSRTQGVVITPAQALNFTFGYAAGTFLLSPDLDLAEGRVNAKRYWGILGFLWAPYGMLFSHRGLSHTWVVGPVTRLVYLALMAGLIWGLLALALPLFGAQLPVLIVPRPLSVKVFGPLLLGYYLSQWLHLLADGVRPDHGLRHGRRKLKAVTRRF